MTESAVVEVVDRAEIVRREVDRESAERALAVMDPAVLDTMFNSREAGAIVQRISDVSTVLMDAVHQRDLARRYGNSQTEFLHIEAWQFLGSLLGMTVVGVDSRPLPDGSGWEATAELRHIASGRVIGRADGMCERSEPGKRQSPNNTLRQMAQLRARRAAARSVLGFVPRIGGFEISDPEAPATTDQVGVLHQLERELGWSHDEGHARANVDSYKHLNREDASTLIDRWQALLDDQGGGGDALAPPDTMARDSRPAPSDAVSSSLSGVGTEESPEPESDGEAGGGAGDSSPASDEAWARAPHDMSRVGAVKLAAKLRKEDRIPGPVPKKQADFTGEQLARVAAAWRDGERG